ncbi:hypothetical protein SprV_0602201700 [Sparganum proliferum]
MAQITAIALQMTPDVICVTESWTHSLIPDSALLIDDFDFYRQDRKTRRVGGCLLYLKSYLKHSPYYLDVSSFTGNFCFAPVILSLQRKTIIGCIYNPPNSLASDDSQLCEIFKFVSEAAFDVKIITGDFNLPEIDWVSNSCPPRFQPFQDIVNFSNWSQLVRSPTRDNHILDLIFTNDIAPLSVALKKDLFDCDHVLIHCCLPLAFSKKTSVLRTYMNYDYADNDLINNYIRSLDWCGFLTCSDATILRDVMSNVSKDILEFVPRRYLKTNSSDSLVPRFLYNRPKKLRRQLRDPSTSSLSVHLRITEIFEMASRMHQARDRQRESIALSGSDPGKSVANIFRHRSSSKRGHELPPRLNDNKVSLIDDTDKAELFSAFFAKHLNNESEAVPFDR